MSIELELPDGSKRSCEDGATVHDVVTGIGEGLARQIVDTWLQTPWGPGRHARRVDKIEKVTQEDIMRVAKSTFIPTNRTVAMIVNEEAASN